MTAQFTIDTTELKEVIAQFGELNKKIPLSALRRAGHKIGDKLKLLLLKPTATWKHKPKIKKLIRTSQKGVIVLLQVNDEPYVWLALGTPAHTIRPVRARRLAFQIGYKAKTTPGSLAASSGGKFGDMAYSLGVEHPGIKARKFHEVAFKEIEKDALKIVMEELEKELKKVLGAS